VTAITVISSKDRCGIQTYATTLADAFRSLGHAVEYVGVGWWDSGELLRASGRIPRGSKLVIVEHEFAVFRNGALALAMLRMRLAGKRVILSLHELEPEKFMNYHKVVAALHYKMSGSPLRELFRVLWATAALTQRMLRYRFALWLLGAFPHRIVFHSPRARENAGLVTGDRSKVREVPHFVEPLPGTPDPGPLSEEARSDRKRELRRELGLPEDKFIFVSPGFLFRRKRLAAIIDATPPDALLVIAGTEGRGPWDEGYLEELRRHIADRGLGNVMISTDYDAMPKHVMAADAVVLFYERAFQSGIASHAIWAEKPGIFTDDPAFEMYRGAALLVRDEVALQRAMTEIRIPEIQAKLVARARELKRELSPEAMARRYLEAV
jgi:glycosyltransferase involved in cell wall biosynthesis